MKLRTQKDGACKKRERFKKTGKTLFMANTEIKLVVNAVKFLYR